MKMDARRFSLRFSDDQSRNNAVTSAFLWLKRRVEESQTDGILAFAASDLLDTVLSEALGPRLIELIKDEKRLSLGHGIAMDWLLFSQLPNPRARPIAAVFPDATVLEKLRGWPAPVLVVVGASAEADAWIRTNHAREPGNENFWPGGVVPAVSPAVGARLKNITKRRG